MIYFNVTIRNPYWWDRFKNIKWWHGATPVKNKFWEVQVTKTAELFRIEFEVTTMQDHAGINLELGLLGYGVTFTLYDNRHWNTDEGRWMFYTEEDGYH
jgi:hypothetical protein